LRKPSQQIDRRAARRRFERAAMTYEKAARLEAEVGARMLERLDYVKLAPRRILDAASGRPGRALGKRYPDASVVALDFALAMLRPPRRFAFFRNDSLSVCAELERLPLAPGSFDLVWCSMALHWLSDPMPALREFARVLAPEGLLMFSTLGPDTLKELRAAAGPGRVHDFVDMHDLGDMLLAAGFAAPVVDMEMIEIQYAGERDLLTDLRLSGQTSARADRPRGLSGRRFAEALRQRLAPKATYEVVYGHAWSGRRAERAPANQPPKTVRVFKRMP
jgi:malonyl-CoA O-methyltransferase